MCSFCFQLNTEQCIQERMGWEGRSLKGGIKTLRLDGIWLRQQHREQSVMVCVVCVFVWEREIITNSRMCIRDWFWFSLYALCLCVCVEGDLLILIHWWMHMLRPLVPILCLWVCMRMHARMCVDVHMHAKMYCYACLCVFLCAKDCNLRVNGGGWGD